MYLDSSGIYVPDVKQRNYPKPPDSRCNWAEEHWRHKNWKKAETYWVKEGQKTVQDGLKKGELQQLSLFTDENRIIRVGGRVDEAFVSYKTKHPAMLPRDHWISLLIPFPSNRTRWCGNHSSGDKNKVLDHKSPWFGQVCKVPMHVLQRNWSKNWNTTHGWPA